jgi:hypothetical protein
MIVVSKTHCSLSEDQSRDLGCAERGVNPETPNTSQSAPHFPTRTNVFADTFFIRAEKNTGRAPHKSRHSHESEVWSKRWIRNRVGKNPGLCHTELLPGSWCLFSQFNFRGAVPR